MIFASLLKLIFFKYLDFNKNYIYYLAAYDIFKKPS